MGIRHEVETQIYNEWRNNVVARWAISKLPLLERAGCYPEIPVFEISFEGDFISLNKIGDGFTFRDKQKYGIAGGFEGTFGHFSALTGLAENRIFIGNGDGVSVLMLEPDEYISNFKRREPLLNIEQRWKAWSTAGVVDLIVVLPKFDGKSPEERYELISKILSPIIWCTSIENPSWRDVVTRDLGLNRFHIPEVAIGQIINEKNTIHSSFISSTKNMGSVIELMKTLRSGGGY